MRRRLGEPAGRTREDARSGLPSSTRASLAPSAGLPIDEHPFEEHRRARRRRLSGESRLTAVEPAPTGRTALSDGFRAPELPLTRHTLVFRPAAAGAVAAPCRLRLARWL